MSNLQQRSFSIVVLCLGLLATTPIGSTVPGLMLAAVAIQMIAGRRELIFPQILTRQSLPTRYLISIGEYSIAIMQHLEKAVHPRWPAKRFVGVVVLLLSAALLLTPVPLSNIAPAIVIALIALAHLEQDGLLLFLVLLAAVVLISFESVAVWGAIVGASFISQIL